MQLICNDKKTIRSKICFLFSNSDLIGTRFLIALSSLLWAILLLLPGDTFTRPMFTVATQVMPEEVWGSLFLIHATSALYSLFYGSRKKILVFVDSILGSFLWTGITIGMFLSTLIQSENSTPPAAIAPSIVIALATFWVLIRYPSEKKR